MSCNTPKQEEDLILTQRGVINPKVIDLIVHDKDTDAIILQMMEDRAWEETPERLEQLSAKFNSYLDYVLDGWLTNQFPQYLGKKVIFELFSQTGDTVCSTQSFQQMKQFALSHGIIFRTKEQLA